MRNAYKNDFQVKELFLETAKHYPWFCWQAEKFLWLSKHYERQSEFALRHTYNCWLRIMKIGRTCTKIISKGKMPFKITIQDILTHQQIFLEPLFFPLHTSKSGHNCVLLQRQVELKLQVIILHILRMHKEYKHKMWNGNSSVGRANQTCGMGTAEWQWRAEHGRFLWLWHLSETCLNVCTLYTNVYNTKEKCSDKTTCLKIWIPMDIKKYNSPFFSLYCREWYSHSTVLLVLLCICGLTFYTDHLTSILKAVHYLLEWKWDFISLRGSFWMYVKCGKLKLHSIKTKHTKFTLH